MNARTTLLAASLALIAGAAGAADLVQLPTERTQLTRAEVQAELLRARAAGELTASGDSYGLQWVDAGKRRTIPALGLRTGDEGRSAARAPRSSDQLGG